MRKKPCPGRDGASSGRIKVRPTPCDTTGRMNSTSTIPMNMPGRIPADSGWILRMEALGLWVTAACRQNSKTSLVLWYWAVWLHWRGRGSTYPMKWDCSRGKRPYTPQGSRSIADRDGIPCEFPQFYRTKIGPFVDFQNSRLTRSAFLRILRTVNTGLYKFMIG